MTDRKTWLRRRVQTGVLLLVVGAALLVISLALRLANPDSGRHLAVVGGCGIAMAGAGIGLLARYGMALRDEEVARRVVVEERDERSIGIRRRAGQRAYWASAAIIWLGLMWIPLGSSGSLPALEGDGLWYFLVGALAIPFAVYVGSIALDERAS